MLMLLIICCDVIHSVCVGWAAAVGSCGRDVSDAANCFRYSIHVSVFCWHYDTSVFDVMPCLLTVRGAGYSAAAGSTRCPHSGHRLQEWSECIFLSFMAISVLVSYSSRLTQHLQVSPLKYVNLHVQSCTYSYADCFASFKIRSVYCYYAKYAYIMYA